MLSDSNVCVHHIIPIYPPRPAVGTQVAFNSQHRDGWRNRGVSVPYTCSLMGLHTHLLGLCTYSWNFWVEECLFTHFDVLLGCSPVHRHQQDIIWLSNLCFCNRYEMTAHGFPLQLFLFTNDFEHLFKYLVIFCIFSSENCLPQGPLCPFFYLGFIFFLPI